MNPQISPEVLDTLQRRNSTILKANAEIEILERAGANFKVREMAQGIEIEIERPCWRKGFVSRSVRIIPWN